MSRGYRCIVLATFGWLILAALPPQQGRSAEQGQAEKAIAQSLENVAASLERSDKATDYNPECKPGEDNRRSDLCAQWKAADAARETADWTERAYWLILIGTLIGGLTLGAAVAAAKFAKDAADHTAAGALEGKRAADAAEAGLKHAREMSRIQLRAYLHSEIESFTREEDNPGNFLFTLPFRNVGETPALQVIMNFGVYFEVFAKPYARTSSQQDEVPSVHVTHGRVVFDTVSRGTPFEAYLPVYLTPERTAKLDSFLGRLRIEARITFEDIFGDKWLYSQDFRVSTHSIQQGKIHTQRCQTSPILVKRSRAKKRKPGGEKSAKATHA